MRTFDKYLSMTILAFLVACSDDNSSSTNVDDLSSESLEASSSSLGSDSSSSDESSSSGAMPESSSSLVCSSSAVKSSSSIVAVPCKTETKDNCKYGTLIDERDGQSYRTVEIGRQVWMAENLNYAYLQPTATLDSSSWCYDNDSANCETYGRLYLWSAAVDSAALFSKEGFGCGYEPDSPSSCFNLKNAPIRGVCPAGWHMPSPDEWLELFLKPDYSSIPLRSRNGWEDGLAGTDDYGFDALPSGFGKFTDYSTISFHMKGEVTDFWTRDNLNRYLDFASEKGFGVDEWAFLPTLPVRCVKDTVLGLDVSHGTMMDNRDGHIYKTVTIGDQTWMAENLNYANLQPSDELDSSSWCYDNNLDNCTEYGRMYPWSEGVFRTVCPEKWHVPSLNEWHIFNEQIQYNANLIKSTTGWQDGGNGSDAYDLNIVPAGYAFSLGKEVVFEGIHKTVALLTTTMQEEYNGTKSIPTMTLTYDEIGVQFRKVYHDNIIAYIRCIKDE